MKYGLLFERFLNPDGIVFPDIDLDTENEGRECIISSLQQKYGKECCAHIAKGKDLHLCGFVVADEPITNLAPIPTRVVEVFSERRITLNCVQYKDIQSSGLIKFDFLDLETVTQMKEI